MRILFLVYHGFSEHSGISKKIHYQVKGLRENGHVVHLCYYAQNEDNHWCRFVDGQVIKDYGKGKLAGLRQLTMIVSMIIVYVKLSSLFMLVASKMPIHG